MFKFYLPFWISLFIHNFSFGLNFDQKPIVVLVASYNNQAFAKKNIRSILDQNYENYRVIYIDDGSTDDTLNQVTQILKNHPKKLNFEIYHNHAKLGAMRNHYEAVQKCKKNEIVVILDGDDWFYSDQTLCIINRYYQDEEVWLTWGSYIDYPSGLIGKLSLPVGKNDLLDGNLRYMPWMTSHCRTFYAGIFQLIKKEDFMVDGKFFSAGCDLAEMYPMLEMARENTKYIPEILYVYNKNNPLSDTLIHSKERDKIVDTIKKRPIYKKVNGF